MSGVITISRGSFSGGKALAECLSRKLRYRVVDRDIIVERAAALGVSQEELRNAVDKPPRLLDRLQHKKYLYLVLLQAALTEEVRTGQAIYHGNAGHLLLKGRPHILRVRIIAPLEFRIRMAQARLSFSRSEAIAHIQKMDQDRKKWTHFLYGVDWGDPALYDIVINLEYLDIADACETVAAMARKPCFEVTPESRQVMEDLATASRVRAALALDPATSELEFEVMAQGPAVSIRGTLPTARELEEIKRIASGVAGVTEITFDDLGLKWSE